MSAAGTKISKKSIAAAAVAEVKAVREFANLGKAAKADKQVKLTVVKAAAAEGTKVCSKCKVAKPLNAETFARDKSSKDGFYGQCKSCEADYRAAKKQAAGAVAAQQPTPAPVVALPVAATPAPKKAKAKK